jgi:hypothetical protein
MAMLDPELWSLRNLEIGDICVLVDLLTVVFISFAFVESCF